MATLSKKDPLTVIETITGLILTISLLAMLAIAPALGLSFKDNPNTVKRSVDATLIEAHPFSKSTGKYSSELAWEGRFQLLDGRTIDQEIDGFFYKNFINGGEKPIKSWVSVSGRQLWKPDPGWVKWRDGFFLTSLCGLVGTLIGMIFALACPTRN